jgi:hypothetical protein
VSDEALRDGVAAAAGRAHRRKEDCVDNALEGALLAVVPPAVVVTISRNDCTKSC